MDHKLMAPYVYWFIAALGLLALEMATGTFYILVFAVAAAIGGVTALLGGDMTLQLVLTGISGFLGTLILRKTHSGKPAKLSDNNLDIGQAVQRVHWHKEGKGRAFYRGTEWDAEAESSEVSQSGTYYIKALRGSTLILTQQKPEN